MPFSLSFTGYPARRLNGGLLRIMLLAQMALATGSGAVTFPDHGRQPVPVLPECTCRYRGQDLSLGAHICLMSPTGPRIAECVREGNVTSWRPGGESCILSQDFDGSVVHLGLAARSAH